VKKGENDTVVNMARECRDLLIERKAVDVKILDLRKIHTYLDYFIICTATSRVHCRSLAKEIERHFSEKNIRMFGKDDADSNWIVLDYSSVFVHLFTDDTRTYYDLERLWADADIVA
jgi:ribosome-associated protein